MNSSADFQTLVEAYANDLYRFAFWLCRNEHSAEDLVQETLLRAWRSFSSLRDAAAAKAWLLTTLRREHYRRKPAADTVSLDDERVATDVQQIEVVVDADGELDIERRLAELPTHYREVLVLQLLFGYSTQEIATLLCITEAAVANRLLRARKLLLAGDSPAAAAHTPAQVIPLRKR